MIKTEFMKLYEELDELNKETEEQLITEATGDDAAKKAASKKFWSAAKYENKMEEEAFHIAFDDELEELGLMDMFDERGVLANDYERIKKAKEANPDSWALKALGKLWALRYKDKQYFKAEEEEVARKRAESERMAAEYERQQAEKKAAEEAAKEREFDDHKELLKTYLSTIDPELAAEYEATIGIPVEEGVTLSKNGEDYSLCFEGWNFCIRLIPARRITKKSEMLRQLTRGITGAIERFHSKKAAVEFNKIDIFSNNPNGSIVAILLTESGKTYEVAPNAFGEFRFRIGHGDSIPAKIIEEPFEVIYTCVYWDDNNHSTKSDSHSSRSISWNSKYASLLGSRIPKEDDYGIDYGYIGSSTETTKIENPTDRDYSHADGIDSWAYIYNIAGATD